MCYWKRDIADKKLKILKNQREKIEREKTQKIVFTNKRSNSLLKGKRPIKQKVEDILYQWNEKSKLRKLELQKTLSSNFAPKINRKSKRIMRRKSTRRSRRAVRTGSLDCRYENDLKNIRENLRQKVKVEGIKRVHSSLENFDFEKLKEETERIWRKEGSLSTRVFKIKERESSKENLKSRLLKSMREKLNRKRQDKKIVYNVYKQNLL